MRYNNIPILQTDQGIKYYKSRIYPKVPFRDNDIYVITTIGDRLDLLAHSYYNDSELWWVISMANNNIPNGTLFPPIGIQIRIPIEIGQVISEYNRLNTNR